MNLISIPLDAKCFNEPTKWVDCVSKVLISDAVVMLRYKDLFYLGNDISLYTDRK